MSTGEVEVLEEQPTGRRRMSRGQRIRQQSARRARVRRKSQGSKEVTYRISKGHGKIMMLVALIFDFLPLLLIMGAIAFVVSSLNDTAVASACEDSAWNTFLNFRLVSWDTGGIDFFHAAENSPTDLSTTCGAAVAGSYAAGGLTGLYFGPILYLVGSVVATVLAFITFVVWFFAKKVNPFAPTPGHMIANLVAFVIESVPLLNFFPGTTFSVWRHVKTSQNHDEANSPA